MILIEISAEDSDKKHQLLKLLLLIRCSSVVTAGFKELLLML